LTLRGRLHDNEPMRQLESSGGLGSLLGALLALSCAPSGPPPEPYSIIIVDIDTLRADHLGVYGYSRSTSPNLDAFARQAIVFDWAFSQAPNTPPSQASILTGLYPSTHGMIGDADRLPDSVTTLAEALAEAGFQTAGFHDGAYMRNAFNMGQGFATYKNNRRRGLAAIGPRAMRWLSNHHQEPFLLLIHTYDVHAPYAPPAPFDNAFIDGLEPASPGFSPTAELLNKIRLSKFTDSPIEVAENDLEWSKALYDGGILYVDHWFGTLMETVRELALDERAIIVVISDHGDEFEEHGSLLHEKLYAPVTRVPLMIRLPGGQHAQRITDLVETIDLMPTLLALVGEAIPSAVQGRSLVPLIEGSRTSDSRIAFGNPLSSAVAATSPPATSACFSPSTPDKPSSTGIGRIPLNRSTAPDRSPSWSIAWRQSSTLGTRWWPPPGSSRMAKRASSIPRPSTI
jgi:hypothetical protein